MEHPFTPKEVELLTSILLELQVSGKVRDVIDLIRTAESILEKLNNMSSTVKVESEG